MDEKILYEQLKEIWNSFRNLSQDNLVTARNIYFDLIKLVITISFGSIPLIGILASSKNVKDAKFLILLAIICLLISIFLGIASLIKHALYFRKSSINAFKELQNAYKASEEGAEKIKSWIQEQGEKFKKLSKGHEDLNYIWSIIQLCSFVTAIILLAIAVYKIL